jgi:hypothetical protein
VYSLTLASRCRESILKMSLLLFPSTQNSLLSSVLPPTVQRLSVQHTHSFTHYPSLITIGILNIVYRQTEYRGADRIKSKGVSVLFLTEHHAMKAYWGGGTASRILDLGTRWR